MMVKLWWLLAAMLKTVWCEKYEEPSQEAQFVAEYAVWRRWDEAAVFLTHESGSDRLLASALSRTLATQTTPLTILPLHDLFTSHLTVTRHRLGAVLMDAEPLEQAPQTSFSPYISWLLLTTQSSTVNNRSIEEHLRPLNLSLDSDVVVAQASSGGWELYQAYSIRAGMEGALVVKPLGVWGTQFVRRPTPVEYRQDLQKLPLHVGTRDAAVEHDEGEALDTHLIEILNFITASVNATYQLYPFQKQGWPNNEGVWVHLLGAVVEGAVDLGLDKVTITDIHARDMFFSLPIVRSMKNIYFKRPNTSAMRDIYLAPFNPSLIACVVTTGIVLATAVATINCCTSRYQRLYTELAQLKWDQNRWSFGESLIWSTSVLFMQGSPWSPRTPSGSIILVLSLCFALIIYNAYAAFITSVLSVREDAIKGLADLLSSDFNFGYTLAGEDESFLRTVNDSFLRQLYVRGLVNHHGVGQAQEGMRRVTEGDYAFFVSSQVARHALNTHIPHDQRCQIHELPLALTRSVVALPMNLKSPYRKLINLSILRMREQGVLHRIQSLMLMPMPRCESHSTFNSAHFTDVYSAFLLLGAGLVAAVGFGILELVWYKKRTATLAVRYKGSIKRNNDLHRQSSHSETAIEWNN